MRKSEGAETALNLKLSTCIKSILSTGKLTEAISYFYPKNEISVEDELLRSTKNALITFGSTILIPLILQNINLVFWLTTSLAVSYFTFNFSIDRLPRRYQNEKLQITRFADLILDELILIKKTNNSIFDAIQFIASGNYPVISKKFEEMIQKINYGTPPERMLLEYVRSQPSETLKNGVALILNPKQIEEDSIKQILKHTYIESTSGYKVFTQQLESRLLIIISTSVFTLPILISLLIFTGFVNTPLIYLMTPILIAFIILMNKLLLRSKSKIIGEV